MLASQEVLCAPVVWGKPNQVSALSKTAKHSRQENTKKYNLGTLEGQNTTSPVQKRLLLQKMRM